MMKKIKNLKQLQAEKILLKQRRNALEDKMRSNWNELKDSVKPLNIARNVLGTVLKAGAAGTLNGKGMVKTAVTYGVTLLADKFIDKWGDILGKRYKKEESPDDKNE